MWKISYSRVPAFQRENRGTGVPMGMSAPRRREQRPDVGAMQRRLQRYVSTLLHAVSSSHTQRVRTWWVASRYRHSHTQWYIIGHILDMEAYPWEFPDSTPEKPTQADCADA